MATKTNNEILKMTQQEYQDYLHCLVEEELSYEFSDRLGNYCNEYEDLMFKYGKYMVIEHLMNHWAIDNLGE
jgi:hypothetical protein